MYYYCYYCCYYYYYYYYYYYHHHHHHSNTWNIYFISSRQKGPMQQQYLKNETQPQEIFPADSYLFALRTLVWLFHKIKTYYLLTKSVLHLPTKTVPLRHTKNVFLPLMKKSLDKICLWNMSLQELLWYSKDIISNQMMHNLTSLVEIMTKL